MAGKEHYLHNRQIAFEQRGIDPNDHNYNCHHIYTREDKKRGLLPPDFDIDAVDNLLPILVVRHEALNKYMASHPEVHDDISTRVDLARMAEVGELDHFAPIEVRNTTAPKKCNKHKRHKHYR